MRTGDQIKFGCEVRNFLQRKVFIYLFIYLYLIIYLSTYRPMRIYLGIYIFRF
jgi:hypothetical protein